MTKQSRLVKVILPKPHDKQREIANSNAKFKIIRAGRRSGKTVGSARRKVKRFLKGKQVLFASPSQKQVDAFYGYVNRWLYDVIEAGLVKRNKQSRIFEFPNPKMPGRIECRTARFPDDLRGTYGDDIVLDEAAYLAKEALDEVIYPMLWDNDGDLELCSTPKAGTWFNDLCTEVIQGKHEEYEHFHFTSFDNPHISKIAIERGRKKMTPRAWEEEGLALLLTEVKGALWKRKWIRYANLTRDDCTRIIVAIDPAVSSNKKSNETGIIIVGQLQGKANQFAVLEDRSGVYTPKEWADEAIAAYDEWQADLVVGEKNNGGDLVKSNLKQQAPNLSVKLVWASKGKYARAEPIAGLYEDDKETSEPGKVVHGGRFDELETQMVTWTIDADFSPDRLDALVWGLSELSGGHTWKTQEFDLFT